MEPTPDTEGRRAGATWVAATGAFLLLAAAAVFIAVRWDQLPEAARLALVGALTGGFLAGGRAVRRTLPATGGVLFHLGALLIPVDVAGLDLRLGLGWRPLLLLEGVVGTIVLAPLAAAVGSIVLATAAGAAVVVLAGGVAAVTPVPAPLLLALAAAGAWRLQRERLAIAWAAVAGLAPVLGQAGLGVVAASSARPIAGAVGAGVLADLGLAGHTAALAAVASSTIAAAVLAAAAGRRRDLGLAGLAGVALVSGAATTWAAAGPPARMSFLVLPSIFVVVEIATTLTERDPFWRRPLRGVALLTEAAAALAAPLAAFLVLFAPFVEEGLDLFSDAPGWRPDPALGVAWATAALGWMLAAWRRQRPHPTLAGAVVAAFGDPRTTAFLALATTAAVVVGTASTIAVAAWLVVLAAGLLVSRRGFAGVIAVAACGWAVVATSVSHPMDGLAIGVAAAALLGLAAGRRGGTVAAALALAGALASVEAAAIATPTAGRGVALLLAAFGAWAAAALADRASVETGSWARVVLLVIAAATLGGTATDALAVTFAVTLLLVVDGLRHDEPRIAVAAALAAQGLVIAATTAAGLDLPATGVALCLGAVTTAGVAALVTERWRLPLLVACATGAGAGLALASGDRRMMANALLLVGGLTIAAGAVFQRGEVGHAGGAIAIVGLVLHLTVAGVTASEPFVAPVAAQLLVAGWQLRRRDDAPSSWVAYAPAIALLGGAALSERIGGGPAWHGLVAGAVGAAAVAAGGARRLAGPLFVGTALVVTATVIESLNTLAGVPTWAWLAVGGSALLATGVCLERTSSSPVEAGRRLVDVVSSRFD